MKVRLWDAELALAIGLAVGAGERLREEFYREGGPRGERGHADVDTEVEEYLLRELTAAFPGYAFLGEETGFHSALRPPAGYDSPPIWIVDPNDGTSAFQAGYRGASVSIALVHSGIPVIGLVYAYNAPTDDGDMVAWAETHPLVRFSPGRVRSNLRNSEQEDHVPWSRRDHTENSVIRWPEASEPETLPAEIPVLVSHKAEARPVANAELAAPRRFRGVVGIAYRLALTAAGEGAVATTLTAPRAWDMAGGHALLRGAGMELYTAELSPVRYDEQGRCTRSAAYFGGGAEEVRNVAGKDWNRIFDADAPDRSRDTPKLTATGIAISPSMTLSLTVPRRPVRHIPSKILDRVTGAFLGQCAGDSLGALVEFLSADEIARRYPADGGAAGTDPPEDLLPGPKDLADGGTFGTIAGQPTDDSEMALLLARTIVAVGGYDPEAVFAAYRWWLDSGPFDAGATISGALAGSLNPESQANGALMRVSPLGVFAAGRRSAGTSVSSASATDTEVEALARADARLTHVHENCAAVNVLFVDALAAAIHGEGDGRILYNRIVDRAAGEDIPREVRDWTVAAGEAFPSEYHVQQGWVRIAWQNALRQMLVVSDPVTAIRDTVRRGGDTDTNAAIAGALLGALYGASAFPARWQTVISSTRAIPGQPGVTHPRPPILWPVDWQELAAEVFLAGADCVLPPRR